MELRKISLKRALLKPFRPKRSRFVFIPQNGTARITTGFPFFVAGLLLVFFLPSFFSYLEIQSWVTIPADILNVYIVSENQPKRSESADQQISVHYRFSYEGIIYKKQKRLTGTVDSSQQRIYSPEYRILYSAAASNNPVDIYVNPENPDHNMLFPKFNKWDLVLLLTCLLFLLIGSYLIFSGLYNNQRRLSIYKRLKKYPDKPWQSFSFWRHNEYNTAWDQLRKILTIWGMGLSLSLVLSLFLVIFQNLYSGESAIGTIRIFINLNILFLGYALFRTIKLGKWGGFIFKFDQIPYTPGSQLKGRIVTEKRLSQKHVVANLVASVNIELHHPSEHFAETPITRKDHKQFSHTLKVNHNLENSGSKIDVTLPIPADIPATGEEQTPEVKLFHYWQLELYIKNFPFNTPVVFTLPIFERQYQTEEREEVKNNQEERSD